jgi:hypothetical protein
MSVYTVKGVKYHKGHEGEPLAQCSLLRDGAKVADYSDGDWGGEARFSWRDERTAPKVRRTLPADYHGNASPQEISVTPEEGLLLDHIKDMTWEMYGGEEGIPAKTAPMHPDIFVGDLISRFDEQKQFRVRAKSQTLYRLHGDPKGQYWTLNRPFDSQTKHRIQQKHGDRLAEIINETLGQTAQPRQ